MRRSDASSSRPYMYVANAYASAPPYGGRFSADRAGDQGAGAVHAATCPQPMHR